MKRLCAVSGIILAIAGGIHAAPPAWWSNGNPPVIDPQAVSNNHGVANIGQAKWMAKSALEAIRAIHSTTADAIETELVGSDKPIASWDAPITQEQKDAQHAPLLIGQLKAIAAPFYSKLHALDAAWLNDQLTQNQTKDAGDPDNFYPWSSAIEDDANKAPVTIGQVKAVFSLHFTESLDSNQLPDLWEIIYFGHSNVDPLADPDADGASNQDEYIAGTDPNVDGHPGADTDGDGIPDSWEILHDLNLQSSLDADEDADGDGLINKQEYDFGSDPRKLDTDGDGVSDFDEYQEQPDPLAAEMRNFCQSNNPDGTITYTWQSPAVSGDWFRIESQQSDGSWKTLFSTTYGSARLPIAAGSDAYSLTLNPETDYLP